MVKNPPAMWETWVRSLGWEDSLEEGMATHPSILAWRIPWTEKPGGLQSTGSQSRTQLKLLAEHGTEGFTRLPRPQLSTYYQSEPTGLIYFLTSMHVFLLIFFLHQFSSFAQLCLTLCDSMNHSTPDLPVHHQLPESTETHVH